LSYQWFFDRATPIAGATNSILAVRALPAAAGDYFVVVSNRFGSVTSAVASLGVVDTTPPVLSLNGPAGMTVEGHTVFIDPGAIAADACAGPLPVTISGSVNTNAPGSYTLRYVATDPTGNSATTIRMVMVVDTTPPLLSGQGTNTTIDCPAILLFTAPTATDNCDPNPTITFSDSTTPGASASSYIVTRTWFAIDQFANKSAPVSQSITVHDIIAPEITCPTNLVVKFIDQTGAMVHFVAAAADNCDHGAPAHCIPESGSTFAIGTTTVRCTAIDASSNAASCNFTVTVLGARGVKQNVFIELVALSAAVTGAKDSHTLEQAIVHLMKSLDSELWIDQTHLERKGGQKVFQHEKNTVNELSELIKRKIDRIPAAVIQGFFERMVRADRLLCSVAIQDAINSGAAAKKLVEAKRKLTYGDKQATVGNYAEAIERYRQAWQRAAPARISIVFRSANRPLQLELAGEPGRQYLIQASTNLTEWVDLATRTADRDGVITFEDVNARAFGSRYYRVKEP